MEEKKEHLFFRVWNTTSPFIVPIAPLATALMEMKMPTSSLTKIICLIIPYLSFILYILDILYMQNEIRNIPLNEAATLYSSRQQTEKISLYKLIKNQPTLRPIKRLAHKLSINAHKLMVILGTNCTCAYSDHIELEENFNKRLSIKAAKVAVIGHELAHVHDKINYKDLAIYGLLPLLTDYTIVCVNTYNNASIPSIHVYIKLLQENWLYRISAMYILGTPSLHMIGRYYEKKADIVSARLGKCAQAFSNYFYTRHIQTQEQLKGIKGLDYALQLLDSHPPLLKRAHYLADIAISEQHAKPCNLLVYNPPMKKFS
jgi:hypothetical protein